jgi:hypothetical protein
MKKLINEIEVWLLPHKRALKITLAVECVLAVFVWSLDFLAVHYHFHIH